MKAAAVAAPKAAVSSSPVRAEKLPARGLARLLFNKSGSRSRRGAGPSPVFPSRTKSVGRSSSSSTEPAALPEGTDPSSPKVTCIGQVRIRKKNNAGDNDDVIGPRSIRSVVGCRCLERTLLCKFLSRMETNNNKKKKSKCCGLFFCRRKATADEEASAAVAFVREIRKTCSGSEEEDAAAAALSATTHSSLVPPKNALLLMRCRSAPHNRSSALALCRFPVSPVPASQSEEEERDEEDREEERGTESCNGSSRTDEDLESRCSSSTTMQQQPAGLMRCKSEPAKNAEKLMEVSYDMSSGGEVGIVQEVGPTLSPPPPVHSSLK